MHTNPSGHHIGGLTGFLKSVGFAIRLIRPTRVIFVFDGLGGSTAKRVLFPEYKANRKLVRLTNWDTFDNREEESDAITNQIVRLIHYLKCLPVDLVSIQKVEADDVIGQLAKILPEKMVIMSTDQDFIQLVTDKITVYNPFKKQFITPDFVKNKYKMSPLNYLNYKIMSGDVSDNVPGIKGMGPKKAIKLFPELMDDIKYPLDLILEKSEELKDKNSLYNKISMFKPVLKINEKLMDLHNPLISDTNVQEIQEIIAAPKHTMEITQFLQMYNDDELGNSIGNINAWLFDCFNYLKSYKKID
jgi:DNA polymerase-1